MDIPRLLFRLLGKRLPVTRGRIELEGPVAPLTIRRDRWGVPHIRAESTADAWFGLGFCQGQDRAFQIECFLRVIRGTLSGLVGREGLLIDRLSRRIGFHRAAARRMEVSAPEIREMVEAFAAGVAAGGRRGLRRRPHELALLRGELTPYTAADAAGVLSLMSFLLASNWDLELARLRVFIADGSEALRALDPAYPPWQPVSWPVAAAAGPALDRLEEHVEALGAALGCGAASNNWALAPARTASGRPLLANDPHLSPVMPPLWYLSHLETPRWALAGASFAGGPGMIAGHNGRIAWGVTAGLADNTDLFIEEVGPDKRSIRSPTGFVPCEVRRELIEVRRGPVVEEEVLVTPRGPIISPALEGESTAISLKATWLEPLPARGTLWLQEAASFEEFRRAFEEWPAMSFNLAYADSSGAIGWQFVGRTPRRRKGAGMAPLPGWDPEAGWEEEAVPFEAMPHGIDPGEGFIATANNPPFPSGEGPFLGADFIDGYRQARILEALGSRSDWDVRSTQALQVDVVSLPWRELRGLLLGLEPADGEARLALDLLAGWDGDLKPESGPAAVFELFLAGIGERLARARAPRSFEYALGKGFTPLLPHNLFSVRRVAHLVRLLREQPAGWFTRPWEEEIAAALAGAVRELRRRLGDDPEGWSWGRLHAVTFVHSLGKVKALAGIFNRGPYPCGGDGNTVAQAAVDPLAPAGGALFVASLRLVVDVGNWDASRFVLPGGQSGNPRSPHYDDQLALYLRGEGIPIAWSPEEVERAAVEVLELKPAR
jgi:penicillin amidase